MESFGPVILIEVILTFGGVLLFALWQLHDVRKAQEKAKKQKQDEKLE